MSPSDHPVIVGGGDDAFAMPLAVALASALAQLAPAARPSVYIFDDGISPGNRARIERVLRAARPAAALSWRRPDLSAVAGISPSLWNTRATYLRLFIPDLLPAKHSRAIYLDSDVVVEGDLGELWAADLGGRLALAVENYTDPTVATGLSGTYKALGLPHDTPYFNSGVMLINLERWRSEQIPARVFDFLRRYGHLAPFADQDGLNAVIAGDWGRLHPRWNVQLLTLTAHGHAALSPAARRRAQAELLARPGILHYTGPRKPWQLRYRGLAAGAFARHLGRSGWHSPAAFTAWAAAHALGHLGARGLGRVKDGVRGLRERAHGAGAPLAQH